jgi:fructose-1,6-bisphosphatase
LIQRILIRGGVFVDPRRSRPPDNAELRHNQFLRMTPLARCHP